MLRSAPSRRQRVMKLSTPFRRSVLGFAAAVAISSALVMPALATPSPDSVTQQITSTGSLTAFVAAATMQSVVYNNAAGLTIGALTLTVNDARGSAEGWNVTIASSDFDYQGASTLGIDIPNAGFVIGTPGTPAGTAGQAVNVDGGPSAVGGGSLDQARKTISADIGFGSGIYTQNL